MAFQWCFMDRVESQGLLVMVEQQKSFYIHISRGMHGSIQMTFQMTNAIF